MRSVPRPTRTAQTGGEVGHGRDCRMAAVREVSSWVRMPLNMGLRRLAIIREEAGEYMANTLQPPR